jgi:hypothetical protein
MVSKNTLSLNIKYRFFVDKFCNWFQDGKPITHKGIYSYNYKFLKIDENKNFYVQEGKSKAFVKFEDKPFLVQSVDISKKNIILRLNDSSTENLDLKTLYFLNNVPYCAVKNKKFEARFSRPALFQISKIVEERNESFFIMNEQIKFSSH